MWILYLLKWKNILFSKFIFGILLIFLINLFIFIVDVLLLIWLFFYLVWDFSCVSFWGELIRIFYFYYFIVEKKIY